MDRAVARTQNEASPSFLVGGSDTSTSGQGRRPLLSGDVSEHLGSLMTRGLAEMGRGFLSSIRCVSGNTDPERRRRDARADCCGRATCGLLQLYDVCEALLTRVTLQPYM